MVIRCVSLLVALGLLISSSAAAEPPPETASLTFDPLESRYLDRIQKRLWLTDAQRDRLQQQAFVSLTQSRQISFGTAYDQIYRNDLPVLITSDSILHVVHRSFANTLKQLEERTFLPLLDGVLTAVRAEMVRRQVSADDPLFVNYRDVDLFVTVALSLSKGIAVNSLYGQNEQVRTLLANIDSLRLQNPLLGERTPLYGGRRAMDFSQFKPRGHYTHSTALKNYFRCMMWLGRADTGFFITPATAGSGIENHSERELIDAAILVDLLTATEQIERLNLMDRALEVLIGPSDNLKPGELRRLLDEQQLSLANLRQADARRKLQSALARATSAQQRINSQVVISPLVPSVQVAPPGLFQFFGQRFAVDSFVLSKVVFDAVPPREGVGTRQMPLGLDMAAALGNADARRLLANELARWGYEPQLNAMQTFLAQHLAREGTPSVYDLWLQSLVTLHQVPEDDALFPQAMRMPAWRHKQLHTQLASWAELRHDTILFVKQSYTKTPECEYPSGFVEPYPAFFAKTRELADQMVETLGDLETRGLGMHDAARRHWRSTALCLQKLEGLAHKELANEPFTRDEETFIKQTVEIRSKRADICGKGDGPIVETFTGWYADLLYSDRSGWKNSTPTVADVHTDSLGRVLEVGVGDVHLAVIAIDHGPDRMAYVGPIYTYYEFTQPASNRLTNEQFGAQLRSNQPPPRPEWINVFEPH